MYAVLTSNSCTKCVHVHDALMVATQFSTHGCMNDLTTELSFDSQDKDVTNVLGLIF